MMETEVAAKFEPYAETPKRLKILWFADEDENKSWNQHWNHEQKAWKREHEVHFWGYGYPGFDPAVKAKDVASAFFGASGRCDGNTEAGAGGIRLQSRQRPTQAEVAQR